MSREKNITSEWPSLIGPLLFAWLLGLGREKKNIDFEDLAKTLKIMDSI